MNLILFQPDEIDQPLPKDDARAVHLLKVLRRQTGDTFDAGLVNGAMGKGTIVEISERQLNLRFDWAGKPPPTDPITLVIGLPRPQTARKILQEATALGVAGLHFVHTTRSEPSYADSTLWTSGEWQRHLEAGAAQAFDTHVPIVTHGRSLADILANTPDDVQRIALDNYEAPDRLSTFQVSTKLPVTVALGPERGWSAEDRTLLRSKAFAFAHLGPRVLRLETAVAAALVLLKAQRGIM